MCAHDYSVHAGPIHDTHLWAAGGRPPAASLNGGSIWIFVSPSTYEYTVKNFQK